MSKQNPVSFLCRPDISTLLFHPRKPLRREPPGGAEEIRTRVDEAVSVHTRCYPADGGKPHILFFHGNGEIAEDYDEIAPLYHRHHITLLVSDYRGYGNSEGDPDAANMLSDAHAVFADTRQWMAQNGRTGPLWVMGRSLGSAPALELAGHYPRDCRGLVIESGFAWTLDLLGRIGLDTRAFPEDREADRINISNLEQYSGPTLIIHAEQDGIIPVTHARALYEHAPAREKEIHIISGADHNSILFVAGTSYFARIAEFMDQAGATART